MSAICDPKRTRKTHELVVRQVGERTRRHDGAERRLYSVRGVVVVVRFLLGGVARFCQGSGSTRASEQALKFGGEDCTYQLLRRLAGREAAARDERERPC